MAIKKDTSYATIFFFAFLLALALAACASESSPRGEFAANQELLKSCDPAAPPASLVQIDGTGSSASDTVVSERMTVIESVARKTAVCSGHLRVLVFSASSAATTVLFDSPLKMDGATENARLKRVPEAVADVMNKVRSGYAEAAQALPQSGSDITAQYRLASEWKQQLGDGYRLNLLVLTDGFQNIGVDLGAQALSKDEAAALADQVTVPKLAGASVVVAGLGRVAKGAPPSAVVEGLVAYYDRLCQRTEAASCISVSNYAEAGR
ncbi:hypothetical protein [Umezawaea sp. Da 62-37]|uniref:hypothetical protein n=1 Tax=Umezawaea sp. Da 62-37 TaxID=3075927 RepID=UPI0028F746CD|nr:hypothetical protein [Umezawaea sp. Da 62-37]WNV83474.1 hypothetical protein RM788_35590 [Umezawaea sp. Da 62-37]